VAGSDQALRKRFVVELRAVLGIVAADTARRLGRPLHRAEAVARVVGVTAARSMAALAADRGQLGPMAQRSTQRLAEAGDMACDAVEVELAAASL
jgi:hypothetical protein